MAVQVFMAARGAPTLEQMDMPEGPWRAHAGAEEVCEEEGAGAPGHPAVPPCCRTEGEKLTLGKRGAKALF